MRINWSFYESQWFWLYDITGHVHPQPSKDPMWKRRHPIITFSLNLRIGQWKLECAAKIACSCESPRENTRFWSISVYIQLSFSPSTSSSNLWMDITRQLSGVLAWNLHWSRPVSRALSDAIKKFRGRAQSRNLQALWMPTSRTHRKEGLDATRLQRKKQVTKRDESNTRKPCPHHTKTTMF